MESVCGRSRFRKPMGASNLTSARFDARKDLEPEGGIASTVSGSRKPRCVHRAEHGPSPEPMRRGRAQSQFRCGSGEPSPGTDVAGLSPVRLDVAVMGSHGIVPPPRVSSGMLLP